MKRGLFIWVSAIVLLSCEDGNPVGTGFALPFMELKVGKTWRYAWSLTLRDSIGNVRFSDADTIVVSVDGVNETVGNFRNLVRLSSWGSDFRSSHVWYAQTDSDFVELAYRWSGGRQAFPKIISKTVDEGARKKPFFLTEPVAVQWMRAQTVPQDSILLREEPRVVYRYPLVPGMSWISFSQPFLQTREAIGFESITVNGKGFHSIRIKTTIPDLAPDLQWYDYVTLEGLIRRTLDMEILITSEDDPEVGQRGTISERLELVGMQFN